MDLVEEALKEFNVDSSEKINLWSIIFKENELCIDQIEKYKDIIDWNSFIMYQEVTSEVLDKFEKYILSVEYGLKNIIVYQVLSEEFLDKHWELIMDSVGLDLLIENQGLGENLLYRALKEDNGYLGQDIWKKYLKFQYLSEEFILTNLDHIDIKDIIRYQRLTKKLIEELGGINYIKEYYKKELNENTLYKSDIGKDWFIGYVDYEYATSVKRIDNLYYPFTFLGNLREEYSFYSEKIVKARIYYDDIWMIGLAKKVEMIKKLDGNFFKR